MLEDLVYADEIGLLSNQLGDFQKKTIYLSSTASWLGHVCRIPQESFTRMAPRWTPQGKRTKGRPRETWIGTMEKELKSRDLILQTTPRTVADRNY